MKDEKYSLQGALDAAEKMFANNPDNVAVGKDIAQKCQGEGMLLATILSSFVDLQSLYGCSRHLFIILLLLSSSSIS